MRRLLAVLVVASFTAIALPAEARVRAPRGSPDPMLDVQWAVAYQLAHVEEAAHQLVTYAAGYVAEVIAEEERWWAAEQARQAAEAAAAARLAEQATPAAVSAPSPSSPSSAPMTSGGGGSSAWDALAQCESGGQWDYAGGSGYQGGLQFAPSTWQAYGGTQYAPTAGQASREQQIAVAEAVRADVGWGAWPACSQKLGLG